MFNLIITIISIALVVVLTATSVYYGGSAFSEGTADAIAATYINQAQQVQAAATLYEAQEGGAPTAISDLTPDYLSSNPKAPGYLASGDEWVVADGFVSSQAAVGATNEGGITAEVCEGINEGGSDLVLCSQFATDLATSLVAADSLVPVADGDRAVIYMAF